MKIKKVTVFFAATVLLLIMNGNSQAHFGMLIPSDSMVMQGDNREIKLVISFSHPFEGLGMEMVRPKQFKVNLNDKVIDLREGLDIPAWENDGFAKEGKNQRWRGRQCGRSWQHYGCGN